MITILYLSHEDDKVMGSTLSLANMVHAMQHLGCHCLVALPGPGPALDFFQQRGITCLTTRYHVDFVGRGSRLRQWLTLPLRYLRDTFDNRRAIRHLQSQLREGLADKGPIRVDIVHTNSAVLDFGPALARALGARHVWHLREFIDLDMGFRPYLGWPRLRHLIQSSDATISITRAIASHYGLSDDAENNRHHYTMFDAVRSRQDILSHQQRLPQFVFCGQLAQHKGPDIAIRAFCRFADSHPGYQLLLMGTAADPAYLQQLQDLVPDTHRDDICFLGYVNHPDTVIARSTALLMCSSNEAQGRVTIEAMLQGCPVIALNAGGTREIIQHRRTGLFFDRPDELPALMEEVSTSDVSALIDNAQAFAFEHFLEESYGIRMLSIYQSLLSAPACH